MTLRGQQFNIDDFDADNSPSEGSVASGPFNFIADVQERKSTALATPPQPPTFKKNSPGGFPAHRKRDVQSRFKQTRQQDVAPVATRTRQSQSSASNENDEDFLTIDRRRIDEENRMKLAQMSPEEIEEERRELLASLDPSLIERLMSRATIVEGGSNEDFPGLQKKDAEEEAHITKPPKTVKFAETEPDPKHVVTGNAQNNNETPGNKDTQDKAGNEAAAEVALPTDSTVHFPRPRQPPSLDPSHPDFLKDLHEKYFPDLPADPEKLEWMTSTPSNAYSSTQTSLDPKDIRFAFTGALIPPSLAAKIPVTLGLHHHGEAPDAAGYTIPELAMLARSSVPAQRCVAFQTLGRVLYRLGKGEFGDPGEEGQGTVGAEETFGELARGLWFEVKKESVLEICLAESDGRGAAGGRHMGAKAYATEAVWLWQQGGGRRWKAE
jgi:hypothetical protein